MRLPAIGALLLALGASACGFRLAGSEKLPDTLKKPYLSIKDPYTDFARELEHQLKASGALLQPAREGSTAVIDVTRDQVQVTTLSVSARNIPTEYELIYTVVFAVRGTAPDKQLLAPQTLTLSRDYSFNENELLAKEHESDILRRQMARDLAGIAVRRLASLKSP